MIDFHSHILPYVDDGAKDVEETVRMLEMQKQQGVNTVVCTSHYYPKHQPIADFAAKRDAALAKIPDCGVKLVSASEVYLSRMLLNADDIKPLCIGDTKYIMLELPFEKKWSDEIFNTIEKIMYKFDVKPIIAHVERYPAIQLRSRRILKLLDMGCIAQLNCGSLFIPETKRLSYSLIKKGYISVLGSDAHNTSSRIPNIGNGCEAISAKLGADFTDALQLNAKKILNI